MSGPDGVRPEGATPPVVSPELDILRARHVTEPSRYFVAVLVSGTVLAILLFGWIIAFGRPRAFLAGVTLAAIIALLWLFLQIRRVRLLGAAVRVSERTTPELFRVIETVRNRLGYTKRTDVYVTERTNTPLQLESLLGTRILVVKGEFVGELLAEKKEAELVFLFATYFGALKARYDRLNLILILLNSINVLHIFNPLINPWYRATVYSGDQMAYLVCHDLRVSLDVAFRSLVGKEMAPFVTSNGVVGQAHQVRRNVILRLYQWFSPSPHATNRYLNLLAFAAEVERDQYAAYLDTLDAESTQHLEDFRRSHSVTGGSGFLMPVADLVAGSALLVGLVLGLSMAGNNPLTGDTFESAAAQTSSAGTSVGEARRTTGTPGTTDPGTTDPGTTDPGTTDPGTTDPGTTDPGTTERDSAAYVAFVESLPYGFAKTCTDVTPELGDIYDDIVVVAWCSPTSSGTPDTVQLYQFATASQARAAFESETTDYTPGGCPDDAPATDTWSQESADAGGLLGCGTDDDGLAEVIWTDDAPGVLSVATGEDDDTVESVMEWWRNIPSF